MLIGWQKSEVPVMIRQAASLCAVIVFSWGCSSASEQGAGAQAGKGPVLAVPPAVSVNAVMAGLVVELIPIDSSGLLS